MYYALYSIIKVLLSGALLPLTTSDFVLSYFSVCPISCVQSLIPMYKAMTVFLSKLLLYSEWSDLVAILPQDEQRISVSYKFGAHLEVVH